MSQSYPPPPQGPVGPPPPGMPGQPMGYGTTPPSRTSGAAIASLICGILGCIPFITSILAVILGLVGIKSASKPGVSGKGLAIVGLILGVLGILAWTAGSGAMYWGYRTAMTAAESGKTFVNALQAGDYEKAAQYTTLSQEEIRDFAAQTEDWGSVEDWSISGFNTNKNLGGTNVVVTGTATFAKAGQKDFELVLGESEGRFKIMGIHFK